MTGGISKEKIVHGTKKPAVLAALPEALLANAKSWNKDDVCN